MGDAAAFVGAMIGARPVEWLAVALGLANITLLIRRSIWNYPFGLVMVSIYAWIFFGAKLYSDAGLQIFFFVVQVYGWMHWARRRDDAGKVIVRRLTARQTGICISAGIVGVALLGTAMGRFTDAAAPYWDGSIAVFSVIAQILLARRYLENWLVWIVVDILAIGLFWTRGLEPTAALYALFLVLATAGYFQWRSAYRAGAEET